MSEGTQKLEFGGIPGNFAMIFGLPVFTAYLYFTVRFNGGALLPGDQADWAGFFASLRPTWTAAAFYAVWWGPGKTVEGTELPDGTRLPYKMNGRFAMVATFGGAAALHVGGLWDIRQLYTEFGAILSVMTIFSYAFSVFLYVYGKKHGQERKNSGSLIHDFWMGTGHNPRVPPGPDGLDLKFFCEARPGLLLWVLINAAFALVQHDQTGSVSIAMWLVFAFQLMYVADYFVNEPAILTTMDIKHENFGFMLCFGDLAWVPMTYTLQAHYLIEHDPDLPIWAAVAIVCVNMLGLYIFRAVNLQKHTFRSDPENALIWGKPVEYIETAQGGKLLVSGFWGWSRHFNYVGDILMALSWSLPCAFGSIVPYFYPIYFAILLIHRERRDHHFCTQKYGADWERYCERVRYRIVPGLY